MVEPHEYDPFSAAPPPAVFAGWKNSPWEISLRGWDLLEQHTSWRFLNIATVGSRTGVFSTSVMTAQQGFGFGVGAAYSYGEAFGRQADIDPNLTRAVKTLPTKMFADVIDTQMHFYASLVNRAAAMPDAADLAAEAPHLGEAFEAGALQELCLEEPESYFLGQVYKVGAAAGHNVVRRALIIANSHQDSKTELEEEVERWGSEDSATARLIEGLEYYLREQ